MKGITSWTLGVAFAVGTWSLVSASAWAQGGFGASAVGGVSINADGVLANATVDESRQLNQALRQALRPADDDLAPASKLRKVSLRGLIQAVQQAQAADQGAPDTALLMAGLQRIEYVFVDRDGGDIILAGPAEGWTISDQGAIVGQTTGQPVMMLDDLAVALRAAGGQVRRPMTCSIDPTAEGMQQLQAFVNTLGGQIGNAAQTTAGIEQALGPQVIRLEGLPEESHFARVLVSADYRMKRLAMGFEPAPVRGMPSFLQMTSGTGNLFPRWWMTTNYESLLRTPEGDAWQLRGPGVKVMTEDSFFDEQGQRTQTGQANPAAQRWADSMTNRFEALAKELPIFGQLRNAMDLAVVAALIHEHRLAEVTGLELAYLTGEDGYETTEYPVPRSVPSQASVLRKGRTWIISASGGVDINPWDVISKTENSPELSATRQAALKDAETFWWD